MGAVAEQSSHLFIYRGAVAKQLAHPFLFLITK